VPEESLGGTGKKKWKKKKGGVTKGQVQEKK